jgi:hypothetical protein
LSIDLQAARLFINTGDRGSVNEHAWRQFLSPLLPAKYAIGVGEIIAPDTHDTTVLAQSEQKDVVVYDPFTSSVFGWADSGLNLFPIESVYAVVEVKTCFNTSDDVRKASRQVYEVKRIQRKHSPDVPSPLTVVFAFSSALSQETTFKIIEAMEVEERPDFLLCLGSTKANEQPHSIYITHWHYVTGSWGEIGFVTADEAVLARDRLDSRDIYLTLSQSENSLLWFYLFFITRLQMVDTQIDKARSPNLWKYAISSRLDPGHKHNEPALPQKKVNGT